MILSDTDILKHYTKFKPLIEPFKPENVQPASVDLVLRDHFLIPKAAMPSNWTIDLADITSTAGPETFRECEVGEKGFTLPSRSFVLGSTEEVVKIPNNMVARVEGKSSLGRLGLLVHSTAGFIDPGFEGTVTLEFYNLNLKPIILRPGLKICQISFSFLNTPATHPYGHEKLGSKYQGQDKTTSSRYQG